MRREQVSVTIDVLGSDHRTSLLGDSRMLLCADLDEGGRKVSISATGSFEGREISREERLDLLALLHNNGCVYDTNGRVLSQGVIEISTETHRWLGVFDALETTETDNPNQFALNAEFRVDQELTQTFDEARVI